MATFRLLPTTIGCASVWLLSCATAGAADAKDDDSLETIVISGLRQSLERSLDTKKNADVVLDSISATELGRFPDDDVADSLRHITGVSISRTTGGEGMYVGIRGLASQYNIVTLNNRIIATDDDGRDLAFDILPADLISGADVYKSPSASALEGSIGGTVNMRSGHPLDAQGRRGALRLERNYNDMSRFSGTKASAFFSNSNQAGTMGFLVGLVHSDTRTRTDSLNYNTYDTTNPGSWPLPADSPGSVPVLAECCISFGSIVDRKQRSAVSATFDWKPNGNFHLSVDGLYTRLKDPQVAYNQAYFPDYTEDPVTHEPFWQNVVVSNGMVSSFDATNFVPELVNQTVDRRVTTSMFGVNMGWEARPGLRFTTDLYRSQANRPEGGNDAFVTAGIESADPRAHSVLHWRSNSGGGLPDISVTLPDGSDMSQALASGALDNNALWTSHYMGLGGSSIHDTVSGGNFDGTLDLKRGALDRLTFGLALTRREKSDDNYNNDWTGGSSQYNFYTTPEGANPISFGSLGAAVVSTTTFPNYMHKAGGNFPMTVGLFDIAAQLNALRALDGQPNLYGTMGDVANYDFNLSLPTFNAVNSYNVREDTSAAYAQLGFGSGKWSGNAGLRLVHTSTTAATAFDKIISVTVADTANATAPATVVYSLATPVTTSNRYTFLLPAVNLNYRASSALQLRLGAASTMARPNLNQLAPTRTDNSLNQDYVVNYNGNSDLKPIRAWQADASLEWYYRPKSALTVAAFYKDIRDFITTKTATGVDLGVQGFFDGNPPVNQPYTVIQPINGDKGEVQGLEFAVQHLFDNGFGVRGQITRTWSKAYIDGAFVGELEGVSPTSGSLGVLYEKGPISTNLNWDYTGAAIEQSSTEAGIPARSAAWSWVTAQFSYEFHRNFKVYIEGKNLSDAIPRTWLDGRRDAVWSGGITGTHSSLGQGYTAFGRMVTLGISYRP